MAGLAAGMMLASVGCGPKQSALKTEEVEGVVTLDGTPVPGATVTFVPVQPDGATATGMTDSAGKYRLTALKPGYNPQPGSGTLPGEYNVGVSKIKSPEPPKSTEETMPKPGERPKGSEITYLVPQKYENPQDSGIKKTVKEGKNDIPIELTSK
ncbi:MAG TPA: carboxypeptidase-like regulatory domain-containing protein [Candidatus Saccharimonadales bacterium]|nr:carboxypeptidase-like regulatory domain-containing protein [Candidatus Saccharimonadales bacterium]